MREAAIAREAAMRSRMKELTSSGAASCDMVEGQTSMPTGSDEDSRSITAAGLRSAGKETAGEKGAAAWTEMNLRWVPTNGS